KKQMWPGMEVKNIQFSTIAANPVTKIVEARSAFGRAVIVDQTQCEIQIYPFYELINANKGRNQSIGIYSAPAGKINLGVSVQNFIEGACPESTKGGIYEGDMKRMIYASNALQTNFVLPNGFIIRDHELICKPQIFNALGLDCDSFIPLNGLSKAFVFDAQHPHIMDIEFEDGRVIRPTSLPKLAMHGPVLVQNGEDVSKKVLYRPNPDSEAPYSLDPDNPHHQSILRLPKGAVEGCEVNYPPPTTMTSFTAFGIHQDKRIIFVSMFEELRHQGKGTNSGITLFEMADLLLNHLDAQQAILGGGSADTQQFLRGDQPQFMVAPFRTRPFGQGGRAEVEGVRGLGAIIAVLAN
ncbi:phosphodiester glycosidase family protein, partial [candidate division KSB1 bacterium]|nr:phosphodiester glycosidase family protein [candidate division KSB1 bacterium]